MNYKYMVKVFKWANETEINEWFDKNPDIKILKITHTECQGYNTVFIYYKIKVQHDGKHL